MTETTIKPRASLGVHVWLLSGGLVAGCAGMSTNLPAEAYANRPATMADVAIFLAQGPIEPRFQQLHEGMTREEVIRSLGKPDRVDSRGGDKDASETLLYLARFRSGWSWDRADYAVEVRGGKVVQLSKGPVTTQPPPPYPGGASVNWGSWKWGK